ncbi:MAG TPA: hypothetical protein VNK43_04665, partial [Gemmatimonadales bacterium]|nr:hypothetical protein [Gemmatimonadales bacterium]
PFGDERPAADTLAPRGRSRLAPALLAAAASGRPILVVTDGEIEDVAEIPADLRARIGVRLFPRRLAWDVGVAQVAGPARVTAGDSIPLDVEVRSAGAEAPDTVTLRVATARETIARRRVRLAEGSTRVTIVVPATGIPPGQHFLRVGLDGVGDSEPRNDLRLHAVTVAATPGVVLIADPGDWDSRFLYRTLRDVAQLPVRGFVRVERDRWRTMGELAPVGADEVRRTARQADLLVLKGASGGFARGSRARGVLHWRSGENGETLVPGDWYISLGESSPLAGAFFGLPVDSFAPVLRITPVQPDPDQWVALTAREGRRGPERPVVVGRDDGRVRRITVAADGFWRWAFRGGSSEQGYRSMMAAAATWLLGGVDTAQGRARPLRAVVANARPVVFEWIASGKPRPTGVTLVAESVTLRDTLRFDGQGRATLWLPVGEYRYRLEGGGGGAVAVETNSDEWFPRPVALEERPAGRVEASTRATARGQLWLFGLCLLALVGEWAARRRLGLR